MWSRQACTRIYTYTRCIVPSLKPDVRGARDNPGFGPALIRIPSARKNLTGALYTVMCELLTLAVFPSADRRKTDSSGSISRADPGGTRSTRLFRRAVQTRFTCEYRATILKSKRCRGFVVLLSVVKYVAGWPCLRSTINSRRVFRVSRKTWRSKQRLTLHTRARSREPKMLILPCTLETRMTVRLKLRQSNTFCTARETTKTTSARSIIHYDHYGVRCSFFSR